MINSYKINHLFYADDNVLLASSSKALQKLIDISVGYSYRFELTFNVKKTTVMCDTFAGWVLLKFTHRVAFEMARN